MSAPDDPSDASTWNDGDPAVPAAGPQPGAAVRLDARLLDPATAVRLPGGPAPSVTAYRGDSLLITGTSRVAVLGVIRQLRTVAADLGLDVVGPSPFDQIGNFRDEADFSVLVADQADQDGLAQEVGRATRRVTDPDPEVARHNRRARLLARAERAGTPLVLPIRFAAVDDEPAPAVDVWPILQRVRATEDDESSSPVGLDHLMFSAAAITGDPAYPRGTSIIEGDPAYPRGTSAGAASYASPGWGGHGPVAVVMRPPWRDETALHPRVVVLDTGVGGHPWYEDLPVRRDLWVDGDPVGMDVFLPGVIATDPETAGPDPMTGELPSHAGHGTFITGLLRQICPEADITTLRVMDGDGVVAEDALTDAVMALGNLLEERPGAFDALVLSLGYYAETGDDLTYTAGLRQLLITLAERGVVTFVAAGNDSTQRPSFPAAFAASWPDPLPLVSVAALNPNGTVALFSNDGPWVNAEAPGANVVSTAPIRENGGLRAGVSYLGPGGRRRSTIDPDDFRSGFAVWSGTSFAAPVLAGHYLAALVENPDADVSGRQELVLGLMRP